MKYMCPVCGYVYDEEKEGRLFSELPSDWVCPVCGAPKSVFVLKEEQKKEEPVKAVSYDKVVIDEDLTELSAGQLSALFSNLQRGCEKQYKAEESEMFAQLAKYFEGLTEKADSSSISQLGEKILENLNKDYPEFEAVSKEAGDRGALRVNTWGTKVTRMQQAILNRYKKEGDKFLEHTNIWVCSVCGFIYVGDNPPELCPVCKVPSWKFEKIEGGKK